MPNFSASRYGNYSVLIPAGSINIRFSVGAAGGGDVVNPVWGYIRGGWGRAGDFRLKSRDYDYTLYFYLGERGSNGHPSGGLPGGSGGRSSVARGGNGYRSGGGGGGASGVYDTGLQRYVVIVGGGGGAGRYADTGFGGAFSAGRGIGGGSTTSSFSGSSGDSARAGHTGGGGGGSTRGGLSSSVAGAAGGGGSGGYSGVGGNSSWYDNNTYYDWTVNSGYSNYGDGFYTLSFDYAAPTIQYFTISPAQIVSGNTSNISYSTSGAVNNVSLSNIGNNLPRTSNYNVSPLNDTSYTLTVSGPGGIVSQTKSIDVITPPVVNLFSDATNDTIIQGQSVNLNWTITGDASTASLSPGVGPVNISGGPVQVSPTTTTTYTLTASHPVAGQGSDQVTITVILPPEVSIVGPSSVDYGQNIILSCEAVNATESLQVLAKYYYIDGTFTDYQVIKELPVSDLVNEDVIDFVVYNDIGPSSVDYMIYAIGEGGLTSSDFASVLINIDKNPDLITIPESLDKIKNEDPVITPEEDTFLTLTVEDIDIPVRIKSDYPIQVEIDNDGVYRDVEQI